MINNNKDEYLHNAGKMFNLEESKTMKRWWNLWLFAPLLLILLSAGLALSSDAHRVRAAPPMQAAGGTGARFAAEAGNYCIGCHSADDAVLQQAIEWRGGVQMQAANPCPAIHTIEEQLYFTERLMRAIRSLRSQLPDSAATLAWEARFSAAEQSYGRLLDMPVTSLDAFVSESQTLRYQMGKIYAGLNEIQEALRVQRILIWASIVSAVMLGSLIWGYLNSLRLAPATRSLQGIRASGLIKPGLLVLLIFALFLLPIFRDFPAPVAAASEREQEKQLTLDESSRAATAAERAVARSWMLGRIGARWAGNDPAAANEILAAALEASAEAQLNAAALWGEMLAAQEAAAGSAVDQEKAALIAASLQSAQSRAWGLRMMAEDWMTVDTQRGQELLEKAVAMAETGSGIYRDLDLRAIAASYSGIDLQRSLEIIHRIADPFVRAWGYREVALKTGNQQLLEEALATASLVEDQVLRVYALTKIAALLADPSVHEVTYRSLEGLQGASLAYSLARLSAASGKVDWVAQIDRDYPAAVAWAYSRLGEWAAAWDAAVQVDDPFERAAAQAAIASAWGKVEKAREIEVPFYRDRSLRIVMQMTGDVTLASEIQNSYDRAVVLVAVGAYQDALAVQGLKETYPLVVAGVALSKDDPAQTQTILERLQREVDKSVVLNALAGVDSDAQFFTEALDFALAARKRGDPLAPIMASLDLAEAVKDPELRAQALQQALQVAERIAIR